mmetsp:Transcript_39713/g.109372  ORF Transcript_39713/g.109372 Transcript_39713/m.109372 type:complete len:122 (+) Transcript_39713:259-624(+)
MRRAESSRVHHHVHESCPSWLCSSIAAAVQGVHPKMRVPMFAFGLVVIEAIMVVWGRGACHVLGYSCRETGYRETGCCVHAPSRAGRSPHTAHRGFGGRVASAPPLSIGNRVFVHDLALGG